MAGKNGTSAFDMILAFDLAFSNRVRSVGDIAVGQYSVKWSQAQWAKNGDNFSSS